MPQKRRPAPKASGLLFGTGGVPLSARDRSTVEGIRRIRELGLDCMEMEFVHGVKMGEATAAVVGQVATETGVRLSIHAPYYINFNAREESKRVGSQEMLLKSARIAALCGAQSVVFHAAFYMGDSPEDTYLRTRDLVGQVISQLRQENNRVSLRPEVMGKGSEFGTIDEVLRLSTELDGVLPALDVGHWHARDGKFNSYDEFISVFKTFRDRLGPAAVANLHIHFSGIRYGQRGEISHLNFADADFQYEELLRALRDVGAAGTIICESPNLEEDALLLQATYRRLVGEG